MEGFYRLTPHMQLRSHLKQARRRVRLRHADGVRYDQPVGFSIVEMDEIVHPLLKLTQTSFRMFGVSLEESAALVKAGAVRTALTLYWEMVEAASDPDPPPEAWVDTPYGRVLAANRERYRLLLEVLAFNGLEVEDIHLTADKLDSLLLVGSVKQLARY